MTNLDRPMTFEELTNHNTTPRKKPSENIVGKGKNAFSPFPTFFSAHRYHISNFKSHLISIGECNTILSTYTLYRHLE